MGRSTVRAFIFNVMDDVALLENPKKEPITVCGICGDSVGFVRLDHHRRERHPDFVEFQHKLARNLFMVTGPGGGILAALFALAAWSHVAWTWIAFLIAIPVVVGVIVVAAYRATKQLNVLYGKQSFRCQVCLEMIPRVAFRDHMQSLHRDTWILAVQLSAAFFAIVIGIGTAVVVANTYGSSRGLGDSLFASILIATALTVMTAYFIIAMRLWRRHRERARADWLQSRGHAMSIDPIHPR